MNYHKKIMQQYELIIKYFFIVLFVSSLTNTSAQTGLNFQGVARTSNNVLLASQDITVKLSILQSSTLGIPEYVEIRKVKTNAQGLFTLVIGDTGTISTLGNFSEIDWKSNPKFLKIEFDPTAGNNFITMGITQFQYVAYAKFANSVPAENLVGVVPVARGGTGSSSLSSLKTTLSIDKVNNTADSLKPISKLTQTALELKLNAADTSKYTKTVYSDSVWLKKLNIADSANAYVTPFKLTSYNLTKGNGAVTIDTTSLSNRINLKFNSTDTAILLRKTDTTSLSNRINLKFNSTDTTILLRKTDTSTLSNRINFKLNISDTTLLLRKADTTSLSNRINLKLNITDTTLLLKKSDTTNLSNRINFKLNISDTSNLLRKTQVGVINGVANLDAAGKIPSVQIPAISFSSVDVVNNLSEMLSLPSTRLIGSIVVRLDSSKNFVLANLPASNRTNWIELVNPTNVQVVNGIAGTNITLKKSDFTDLANVDNTSDESKPLSLATRTALALKLNISDTSRLLKKSDTSFLLQKVDTAVILAMYAKKFTKDVTVNFGGGNLGKYANGSTIPATGKTLDEFLYDIVTLAFHPSYNLPSVTISATPAFGSYEIGYNPGLVILSYNFSKNDGGDAITATFNKGGVSLGTGVYVNTPGTITNTISYGVNVSFGAGTTVKNNNIGQPDPYGQITAGSASSSSNYSTFSKRYWGGLNSPFNSTTIYDITTLSPLPSSDNLGGNKSLLTNISITGTQYAYYAYPATNPDLTSIMYNNFESINTFNQTIVHIKNAQGYTQDYKVYTSINPLSATLTSISFN